MIKLKGIKAGLLKCVVPEDLSEKRMLEELEHMAAEGSNILNGCGVEMDMGARPFTPALIIKIWKSFVEPSGCHVDSWTSTDANTIRLLERIGLQTDSAPQPRIAAAPAQQRPAAAAGLLFAGNLRGGQRIEHDGDVIIAGHVHEGAEVFAKGHVVVLGSLRGIVHAGCGGDESMSVCVRSLETGQIRVGSRVGMIERKSEFWGKPAVITVRGGSVLLAGWPNV